jgi:hypothetical protein
MKLTIFLSFSFVLLGLVSCSNKPLNIAGGGQRLTEIKRISSPDNKVDAVLVESGGGATVANGHEVFLVLPGKKITDIPSDYSCFTADHTRKPDIEWTQNKRLLISYDKARIFRFTNFWHSDSLDNWNYIIELKLKPNDSTGQLIE